MEITEFRFTRVRRAPENPMELGVCEITLDHCVILDQVKLVESDGDLRFEMWGTTLCDFAQLKDSLKLGLTSKWLEDFRSRLRLKSGSHEQDQTRAA